MVIYHLLSTYVFYLIVFSYSPIFWQIILSLRSFRRNFLSREVTQAVGAGTVVKQIPIVRGKCATGSLSFAIMADTSLPGMDQRKLRERLSQWDAQTNPKAPLSTAQKDVLIDLTNFANDRPMPDGVAYFFLLYRRLILVGGAMFVIKWAWLKVYTAVSANTVDTSCIV